LVSAYNPALEESSVKTGQFASYQKISSEWFPRISVYQSLWYLLTLSLLPHKLL